MRDHGKRNSNEPIGTLGNPKVIFHNSKLGKRTKQGDRKSIGLSNGMENKNENENTDNFGRHIKITVLKKSGAYICRNTRNAWENLVRIIVPLAWKNYGS